MSEAKPASTKKDKKKKVEENGEIVSESSEHSVATDSEPKKSSKSKKNQNGASSEDVSVESESVSEESSKKKKKKSSSSSVAATEASTEGNAAEGEADELEPIGPKHDRDVAGVVASFNHAIVKARKGNEHGLEEDIRIDRFIKAFKDLMPILRLLGTSFYFVEQDIQQKLTAIQDNQAKVKDDPHATNVIDFIHWEKETNPKIRADKHTTARHTLRLMRALHFIHLFLAELNTPGVEPKPAAKTAYATSLSQYHPWSVRTAVSVAFYTLPYRKNFMKHLDLDNDKADVFADFVRVTGHIRTILNLYYDANDWQTLP